jgi:hypothetical protein
MRGVVLRQAQHDANSNDAAQSSVTLSRSKGDAGPRHAMANLIRPLRGRLLLNQEKGRRELFDR